MKRERFSSIARRAATLLWRHLGEDVRDRSPNWKQFDRLYPAACVILGAPLVASGTVSVAFEYQGKRDAAGDFPVLSYVQSDDDPAYVYISALNAKAWSARRKPSSNALQGIADRDFQGCVHHELSDLVAAHAIPSDTCTATAARVKKNPTGAKLGPTIRFVAATGPIRIADIRESLRASHVPFKLHELSTKITSVIEKTVRVTGPKKSSRDPTAVTLTIFPRAISVRRTKTTSPELLRAVVHALARMKQLDSIESGPKRLRAADIDRWLE